MCLPDARARSASFLVIYATILFFTCPKDVIKVSHKTSIYMTIWYNKILCVCEKNKFKYTEDIDYLEYDILWIFSGCPDKYLSRTMKMFSRFLIKTQPPEY